MKQILSFIFAMGLVASAMAQTSTVTPSIIPNSAGSYSGFLGVKDTLTNTDTTIYIVKCSGQKSNITFACNVIKLTGTVAGKFEIYGSSDGGVSYETAVTTTVTKGDATANYSIELVVNSFDYYKVMSISSGTNTHSQRCHLLFR